jgi:serine protease
MSLLQALSRGRLAAVLLSLAGVGLSHAGAAEPGRVIVQFKSDLSSSQRQALAAGKSPAGPMSAAAALEALQSRASALAQRRGLSLRSGLAINERSQVILADGADSATLASRLAADPDVQSVVVDQKRYALRVPNDPLYVTAPVPDGPIVGQWYLRPPEATTLSSGNEMLASINAQGAWDMTTGHSSVVIAVLDSGVRPDHPDLAGKLLPGYDMIETVAKANDGDGRDSDPSDPGDWISAADVATSAFSGCPQQDSHWHGTQVAGLIGAATNNGVGIAGAGWNISVLPVRVLGKCGGYDSDIIAGMRWAAGLSVPGVPSNPNPARVINLSLGSQGACTAAYRDALPAIQAAGVTVVAAAGNDTGQAVESPANCPGVIAVAAVRHIGVKVDFSNVGPEISIAAPGGNCGSDPNGRCLYPLVTTFNSGTTTPGASSYTDGVHFFYGTSFSAPLVSATVGLMLTANRSLTPAGILAALKSTARPFPSSGAPPVDVAGVSTPLTACHSPDTSLQKQCYCTTSTCGAGLLDAAQAVRAVARLEAYIDASTTTPQPGTTVTLNSDTSTVLPLGDAIASRTWSVVSDPNGIAGSLSATSGPTVTIKPTAPGQFTVRLTVTDAASATSTTDQVFIVPAPSSGGGGGAMSATWLAALALAVVGLAVSRR